jgi:hypothetical protein
MDEKEILRQAREAIRREDKVTARALLSEAIRDYPDSEIAWVWLSAIVDDPERERQCLERVLAINPDNPVAQKYMQRIRPIVGTPDLPEDVYSPTEPILSPTEPVHAATEPVYSPVAPAFSSTEPMFLPAEPPAPPAEAPASTTAPSVLELYGAGLVLSGISPTFYWHAMRRRASSALYFIVLFGLVIATIQTLGISHTFGTFTKEVEQSFASGAFPQLTLSGGRLAVEGPDPYIREYEGGVLIVDTTGTYGPSVLQKGRLQTGFLLTRSTLYMLNQGEMQSAPLDQIQPMLGDPFVLDGQLVRNVLDWLQTGIYVVLMIAHTAGSLINVAILSLVVRAVASRVWTGVTFGPVFTIGVYATVPVTYGMYVLSRIGIVFCGLRLFLLLVVWAIGLVAAFAERGDGILKGGRPLRSWRALIGVPMLVILALDAIFSWSSGGIVVVGTTLMTLIVLAVVGLWPMWADKPEDAAI